MIVSGKHVNIIDSVISYESGITWRSANSRVEGIDYGRETDHLSAKISVWGTVAEIAEFRVALPKVTGIKVMTFSRGEKPFGPAFDCEGSAPYQLIDVDDVATADKGVAQMTFQIAASPMNLHPACNDMEFDLSKFAVQEIKRESAESKSAHRKEVGWAAFRHGWYRPKFTLSLLAYAQVMGGTIGWITKSRMATIAISCGDSMMLIDSNIENAVCTAFGNLHRIGNAGIWQADFDFVRAADADSL